MGDRFTIADGYALYALRVWKWVSGSDLPSDLGAYHARIVERPAVKAALEAEGLAP